VITLSRSHIVPFLTFSERRDLREQAWQAWTSRGEHAGETDNRAIVAEILALRLEQARLHGYASYADYALADTMAGSRAAVTSLLERVWQPAKARAVQEREALEALALSRGQAVRIEPWDWRFYAEKLRQIRYDLDEAAIKPYFPLERIVEAAFDCAGRLFGIRFVARPEIRVYHPDVVVYEVRDARDAAVGLFLHDNFARATKRSGAWMSAYRVQSRNVGGSAGAVLPIIVNNNNFAKARRASRRCSASTTHARSSTSSDTGCTGCFRMSPTSACPAPTCCATSSSCRRSCSSTGSRSPRS
jgi:peptidyl-dipeptidase Dcp